MPTPYDIKMHITSEPRAVAASRPVQTVHWTGDLKEWDIQENK